MMKRHVLLAFVLIGCGARTLTKMGADDAGLDAAPTATPTPTPTPTPSPTPTVNPGPVNAVILNDCAPNDGPAFRLVAGSQTLTCKVEPNVSREEITVYQSIPKKPASFTVTGSTSTGTAQVCTNGMCVQAVSATVNVTSLTDQLVIGTYQITLKGNVTTGRSFVAMRCNNSAMCG